MDKTAEIITEISQEYPDLKAKAKNALCVFLLGCFCPVHKPFLFRLQTKMIEERIPCIIMDQPISGIDDQTVPNRAKKFGLYCDKLLKSWRRPLIFLYAANVLCGRGDGARYELVTLCENQKYISLKSNLRLFKEDSAKLPDQQLSIVHHIHVKNGEDFILQAVELARFEVNSMEDSLTNENDLLRK